MLYVDTNFKPGDWIISLENRTFCRKIGTVHKVIPDIFEYASKEENVSYIDMEYCKVYGDKDTFRFATDLEVVTAKLLGTCYDK